MKGKFVAIVGVWVLLGSVAQAEESAWTLLKKGREHLAERDYKRAKSCLESALRRDSRCTQANYYLGRLHEERHNTPKALESYSSVPKEDPTYTLCQDRMARIALRKGDKKKAVEHFELAANARPSVSAWTQLATTLLDLKEYDKAAEAIEKAAKMTKGDVAVEDLRARLYMETEKYDEALDVLRTVSKQFPRDSRPKYSAGVCLLMLDRKAEAEAIWLEVLESDPYNRGTIQRLIDLWGDDASKATQKAEMDRRLAVLKKSKPIVHKPKPRKAK